MLTKLMFADLNGRALSKLVSGSSSKIGFCSTALLHTLAGETVGVGGYGDDIGHADAYLLLDPTAVRGRVYDSQPLAISSIRDAEDGVHPLCSRSALQGVVDGLAARGIRAIVGFEVELYLLPEAWFAVGGAVSPSQFIRSFYGSFQPRQIDLALSDVSSMCDDLDIPLASVNGEFEAFQFEFSLHASDPVKATDDALLLRHVLKLAAQRNGLMARLMPKPFEQCHGNGLHINVSLWGPDGPLYGVGDRGQPTDNLMRGAMSILDHIRSACAFWTPTINSYSRLQGNDFGNAFAGFKLERRDALLRAASSGQGGYRLEVRVPDSICNPYSSLAVCLSLIGTAGEPPSHADASLVPALPRSLREALDELSADERVVAPFSKDYIRVYDALKRAEVRYHSGEMTVADFDLCEQHLGRHPVWAVGTGPA